MAAPLAPASANWELLGEALYRREDVYSMQWNVSDLADFRVASSRNGGPVGAHALLNRALTGAALMRDDSRPTTAGKQAIGKPKLFVYDSAGGLLQTIIVRGRTQWI